MLSPKLIHAAKLLVLGAALATGVPALAADPAPAAVNVAPATAATWKSIDGNLQTLESLVGAVYIDELDDVSAFREALDRMSAQALPTHRTEGFLAGVRKEI